jgi:hypothetical protein
MKVTYIDVPKLSPVSACVVASFPAPGANPNTLSEMKSDRALNYGGLDETAVLYCVFENIRDSVLHAVTADIDGKVLSIRWGCDGKNAWISIVVKATGASVGQAVLAVAKNMCSASYSAYAKAVSIFRKSRESDGRIGGDKDAFGAALGGLCAAAKNGLEFVVIGKVNNIKDDKRKDIESKAEELVKKACADCKASGSKRSLEHLTPDYRTDIKAQFLTYLYLDNMLTDQSKCMKGGRIISNHVLVTEKIKDKEKIEKFADKYVKAYGADLGVRVAFSAAKHAALAAGDIVSMAKSNMSKASIVSAISGDL